MGNQGVTSPVKNCNTKYFNIFFSGKKKTRFFKDLYRVSAVQHPGSKKPNEMLISSLSNISKSKGKKQLDD